MIWSVGDRAHVADQALLPLLDAPVPLMCCAHASNVEAIGCPPCEAFAIFRELADAPNGYCVAKVDKPSASKSWKLAFGR